MTGTLSGKAAKNDASKLPMCSTISQSSPGVCITKTARNSMRKKRKTSLKGQSAKVSKGKSKAKHTRDTENIQSQLRSRQRQNQNLSFLIAQSGANSKFVKICLRQVNNLLNLLKERNGIDLTGFVKGLIEAGALNRAAPRIFFTEMVWSFLVIIGLLAVMWLVCSFFFDMF